MKNLAILFLVSIFVSLSVKVSANPKEVDWQYLVNLIEAFPEFKEGHFKIKVVEYEYTISQSREEMTIYTYGSRQAYDIIANYLMDRNDFKWDWKREGRRISSVDFYGRATINNDDIKTEVRFGCWECDGKDKWDQYTFRFVLID